MKKYVFITIFVALLIVGSVYFFAPFFPSAHTVLGEVKSELGFELQYTEILDYRVTNNAPTQTKYLQVTLAEGEVERLMARLDELGYELELNPPYSKYTYQGLGSLTEYALNKDTSILEYTYYQK